MIGIVDYGSGNVQAFANIYSRLGIASKLIAEADQFEGVSHIVLPGVGSFDWAMERLNTSGMREQLEHHVCVEKCPVLGVCVGMQIMAKRSDEGVLNGLGWLDAESCHFKDGLGSNQLVSPHMGWNDVIVTEGAKLFEPVDATPSFYFLHSYFLKTASPDIVAATAEYGDSFACAVAQENIFGVQFHPEKSHAFGVNLLKKFAEI